MVEAVRVIDTLPSDFVYSHFDVFLLSIRFVVFQFHILCVSCVCLFQDQREEAIQAWYLDDNEEDQKLPHHKDPKEFVSLDKLAGLCVLLLHAFFHVR